MTPGTAVVVGGANLDVKARTAGPAVTGTSNRGTTGTSAGGVGRNIAENLARLGTPVRLVTAVGQDAAGDRLLSETAAAGVRIDGVHRSEHATGTYTAVLDGAGELVIGVADMRAVDGLLPEHLPGDLLEGAALVVVDGNLAPVTAARVLDLAAAAGVPVLVEPVSVPKAAALATVLRPDRPLLAVTPNVAELAAMRRGTPASLHDSGAHHVWVRFGATGSELYTAGEAPREFAAHPATVVDVTGAGDAMLAAFAHALLAGHPPDVAVEYGHAAAALTVESADTVRRDLTADLLDEAFARRSP